MTTRTLKLVHHKARVTHCVECGRMLPKKAYRVTCATCRKPENLRFTMREIYRRSAKRIVSRLRSA